MGWITLTDIAVAELVQTAYEMNGGEGDAEARVLRSKDFDSLSRISDRPLKTANSNEENNVKKSTSNKN